MDLYRDFISNNCFAFCLSFNYVFTACEKFIFLSVCWCGRNEFIKSNILVYITFNLCYSSSTDDCSRVSSFPFPPIDYLWIVFFSSKDFFEYVFFRMKLTKLDYIRNLDLIVIERIIFLWNDDNDDKEHHRWSQLGKIILSLWILFAMISFFLSDPVMHFLNKMVGVRRLHQEHCVTNLR